MATAAVLSVPVLAGSASAAGPFDPATVVTAKFPASAPKAVAAPAAVQTAVQTQPPPAPAPAVAAPVPQRSIVLEINLKVDDQRTVAPEAASPPPSAPAPAVAASSSPFDFSAATSLPAVLSVPNEGVPAAAPVAEPQQQPSDQLAAADTIAPPAADTTVELRLAEPVATPRLADKPIRFGEGIDLGMAEPRSASCFDRSDAGRVCIIPVAWPAELEPYFKVNSALYRGTKAVARVDVDGRIEVIFGLFPAENFDRIAGQFALLYGAAESLDVPMALVGDPKGRNRVLRWRRLDDTGKTVILELRANDDMRDILPDQSHGVVRLYHEHGQPLFHDLQTTDFLLHAMRAGAS